MLTICKDDSLIFFFLIRFLSAQFCMEPTFPRLSAISESTTNCNNLLACSD